MGTIEQKISDYYKSYMDVETLNELGISPLLPGLTTLDQIETREQLIAAFGRAQIDNTASPLAFICADRSDADRHQLNLSVGGLGLPDRDYYLEDTEEFITVREEYVAHITRILVSPALKIATPRLQRYWHSKRGLRSIPGHGPSDAIAISPTIRCPMRISRPSMPALTGKAISPRQA